MIRARATRWRCRNAACGRRIFAERLPHLAARYGRWTTRLDEIIRLFGHSAGGDEIRALYEAGSTVSEISRKLGLGLRRVHRWVCRIDFPERNVMAPKPSTPAYFGTFLAASWAQGTTKVRHLFSDIRRRGYTGSFSHLARFVAPWRQASSV